METLTAPAVGFIIAVIIRMGFFLFFYHFGSQFCLWLLLHNNLRLANAPLLPLEFANPVVTIIFHGQLLSSGRCGYSLLQERLQGGSVAQKSEKNMKHESIRRGKGCLLKSCDL